MVDSPDSSLLRLATSMLDTVIRSTRLRWFRFSKRYLNYGFFYDGIRSEELTSTVYLSPFGVSYLTLSNNYKNVNQQLILRIQISRGIFSVLLSLEFSYRYLIFLIIGYIIYNNAKAFFLNILFTIVCLLMHCFTTRSSLFFPQWLFLSWLCMRQSLRISFSFSSFRVLRTRRLKLALKLFLIGLVVRCLLSHSFYLYLTNLISQYTLPFIMLPLSFRYI